MSYIQKTSCSSASESVSCHGKSHVVPTIGLPSVDESMLSASGRRKLEYALERHKEGLELLSL
ncbi:MAG: hypothetical protein LBS92_00530 [Candidatus Methanoplasma sp.]|jgi:hypothetical protein|nr:hypothetical protein [Candidatus Methanoplasma sp.]